MKTNSGPAGHQCSFEGPERMCRGCAPALPEVYGNETFRTLPLRIVSNALTEVLRDMDLFPQLYWDPSCYKLC